MKPVDQALSRISVTLAEHNAVLRLSYGRKNIYQ